MWIRPRGRGDLCSEMGIEMGRERERARICKVVVKRNNKKIEKNEYFVEISCEIDKLM